MKYSINYDKTVNQLVPHYMGGRKLILYLQAILHPLQELNDAFCEWAFEQRIEASMTSQIFKFEWFLNRKFKRYFANPQGLISIQNNLNAGVPLYKESEDIDTTPFYKESEGSDANPAYYRQNEQSSSTTFSFIVHAPEPDTTKITQDSYNSQLCYWINKYKLASKTFTIKYHS